MSPPKYDDEFHSADETTRVASVAKSSTSHRSSKASRLREEIRTSRAASALSQTDDQKEAEAKEPELEPEPAEEAPRGIYNHVFFFRFIR